MKKKRVLVAYMHRKYQYDDRGYIWRLQSFTFTIIDVCCVCVCMFVGGNRIYFVVYFGHYIGS